MTDIDLDALEALAEAATPGPWLWDEEGFMGCGQVWTNGPGVEGGSIAAPSGDCYPRSGYSPKEDMQFIAAARTAVPALVQRVRELEGDVDRLCACPIGVKGHYLCDCSVGDGRCPKCGSLWVGVHQCPRDADLRSRLSAAEAERDSLRVDVATCERLSREATDALQSRLDAVKALAEEWLLESYNCDSAPTRNAARAISDELRTALGDASRTAKDGE